MRLESFRSGYGPRLRHSLGRDPPVRRLKTWILGAFIGAVAGELSAGKDQSRALRAGWGVFVGMMAAMAVKLVVSGIMTFYFIRALL